MQELVPVVIGIAIGMLVGPRPTGGALVIAAAAALALGAVVAWVTGELARSPGYVIIDAGVIACTAVLVVVAQRLVRRSRSSDKNTAQEVGRG